MQLIDGLNGCDSLLDLLLTNKEDSITYMKAEGCLSSINYKIREFKIS